MLLPQSGNYNIKYYLASMCMPIMILKGLLAHALNTYALAIYKYNGEKETFKEPWPKIHG